MKYFIAFLVFAVVLFVVEAQWKTAGNDAIQEIGVNQKKGNQQGGNKPVERPDVTYVTQKKLFKTTGKFFIDIKIKPSSSS